MASQKNIKLRLEPNSFGSIRLSVIKDGRSLPLNSSDISSDIRQLSRYSLSNSQFVQMLIQFLNDNPSFPLEVKVQHLYFDCVWDSEFISHDVVSIELVKDTVFVNQFSNSKDKFIFAKQFCLDMKRSKLGVFVHSTDSDSSQFLSYLNINDGQKKGVLKSKLKSKKKSKEIGGPEGLEPTRYGDWEKNGICHDF